MPLLVVGAWFGLRAANAETLAPTQSASLAECCTPDCCPPDCCPGCCNSGQVAKGNQAAKTDQQAKAVYICPLTGEQLACPECCPLNQKTVQVSAKNDGCPPCPLCP